MDYAKKFSGFVFDLDGVIWHGENIIYGAGEVLERLSSEGKKTLFITNNASKSRRQVADKLKKMGVSAGIGDVITSGYVTAEYIKEKHGPSRLYVVGMEGLTEELELAGHELVDEEADFVVVGMDENFSYDKLLKAFAKIHYGGAGFILADDDDVAPREGMLVPVAGSISASIEYATKVKPEVMGKPHKPMGDLTLRKLSILPDDCLLVGDNLDTDIRAGKNWGMKTALVLTGVSGKNGLDGSDVKPDYILSDVSEIL